jgi:hypothetical protein
LKKKYKARILRYGILPIDLLENPREPEKIINNENIKLKKVSNRNALNNSGDLTKPGRCVV